jgi:hypothetical protein
MSMAFLHFQHTVNNQFVRDEITRLEVKSWMSLGSRDKSALMTLPQLLKVIEENWKEGFDDPIRDKRSYPGSAAAWAPTRSVT